MITGSFSPTAVGCVFEDARQARGVGLQEPERLPAYGSRVGQLRRNRQHHLQRRHNHLRQILGNEGNFTKPKTCSVAAEAHPSRRLGRVVARVLQQRPPEPWPLKTPAGPPFGTPHSHTFVAHEVLTSACCCHSTVAGGHSQQVRWKAVGAAAMSGRGASRAPGQLTTCGALKSTCCLQTAASACSCDRPENPTKGLVC